MLTLKRATEKVTCRKRKIRVRTQVSQGAEVKYAARKVFVGPQELEAIAKSQLIQCLVAPSMVQVIPAVQFGYSGSEQCFENTEYPFFSPQN